MHNKRRVALTLGVFLTLALVVGSVLPAIAAIQAQVIGLDRVPPDTVRVKVAVNRGVYLAATQGNAPFTLVVVFTYISNGQPAGPDEGSIALKDTKFLGSLDNKTALVLATFTLLNNYDLDTNICTAARITTRDPSTGETIDVTEAQLACH